MKKLFWILIIANVIFFALMQQRNWWGNPGIQAQPDLHGEQIHLLPGAQNTLAKPAPLSAVAAASAVASPPVAASAILAAPVTNQKPAAGTVTQAPPSAPVCLEWGDFSGLDLTRASDALSALQLGSKLGQRQIERSIGYWVYIPPLKNKSAINRKIAELKKLGITEYFVVLNGQWKNAVSLGAFKSQDAAQNFLHDLQEKGVVSARLGERSGKVKATLFMLDRVDDQIKARMIVIQRDFTGSEMKEVPCACNGSGC